jgi:glutathione S-transferase
VHEKILSALGCAAQVPVIVDANQDGKWVNDSWAIAKYLEATYPDRPSLFGGPQGQG